MLPGVRLGILGGTFDPPHLAHLIIAEAASRTLELEQVLFMPAGDPWQKAGRALTPAHHRVAMTSLAIEGVPYFRLDERETRRAGPTYTIDTLRDFDSGDDLVLILGSDAAARLPSWKAWEEVTARASIAVVPRPRAPRSEVDATGIPFTWIEMPELEVSASLLRAMGAEGRSLRFYVAERVWDYMGEHGLYGQSFGERLARSREKN